MITLETYRDLDKRQVFNVHVILYLRLLGLVLNNGDQLLKSLNKQMVLAAGELPDQIDIHGQCLNTRNYNSRASNGCISQN